MVAFIVGNADPDSPILTTSDMPGARALQEPSSLAETEAEQCLIPGLPDDMARKCLARVPFWFHARCKVVSKGWKSLYSACDLLQLRLSEGVAEEYLVCFPGANPSVCQGQLYYPLAGKWRKIPPTPVELHSYGLESFGVVATGQQIFVIGGVLFDARSYPTNYPVPSRAVYRFDLVLNRWDRVAPMTEARGSAACAVAVSAGVGSGVPGDQGEGGGGQGERSTKLYVAGGDGRYAQSQRRWSHLSSAEVYDAESDTWTPLPPMNSLRAGSSGVMVDNKFTVVGGFGAPRLIGGFLQVCEQCPDSEIFHAGAQKWAQSRLAWFPEDRACTGPVAQLGDGVFMLLGSAILRLQLACGLWCHETSLEWSDRDSSFFALNGELHVVPSEKASSKFQKHFSYDPVHRVWRTSKLRAKLRYLRFHQACKQPFRTATRVCL